jgi:hypothetical protein
MLLNALAGLFFRVAVDQLKSLWVGGRISLHDGFVEKQGINCFNVASQHHSSSISSMVSPGQVLKLNAQEFPECTQTTTHDVSDTTVL